MGYKFGRTYNLQVGTIDGETITIQLPFTIEFEVSRNILTSVNTIHLRIYNLAANTRNKIRFNFYDTGRLVPIVLQAGYGSDAPLQVFTGNITQAWSVREGVNWITTIEAFDGGFAFANAISNLTFPAGTPQKTIITALASSLSAYGVSLGAIGNYPGTISRGNTYSGNTINLLTELTNGGFFIDGGKVYCLGNSEVIQGGIALINAQSGLLGTPLLQQTILSFDMLFEPGVIAGQQIQLQSLGNVVASVGSGVSQNINGFYKIISIKHRAMISAAVCGDAITSLEMYYGTTALTPITTVTSTGAGF